MSAWRYLLRIFWALKWPLLSELLMIVFWMVVLENAIGLIQREIFDQLTGEASVSLGIWELCAVLVAIGVLSFTIFIGGVVLHDYSHFNVAAMLQRIRILPPDSPAGAPLAAGLHGRRRSAASGTTPKSLPSTCRSSSSSWDT